MKRSLGFGSLMAMVAGLLVSGCSEYDIIGPGEWQPAEQPEELGETYLEDRFIQRTAEASDILFVIDNSCSMQEEQNALQANFWNFIQFFVGSGLDYHIGITVLDDWANQPPIGQLYGATRYIDPTTPDPVGAFTGNMTMGDDGMGACEVGLEASYRALTPPLVNGYNAGFYREDALLSIVIVSDEVDGSVAGCDAISYMEYIPWLTTLKGSHSIDMIHFAAIVGDQPNGCSSNWGDADPGRGYYEVYTALGDEHSTYFSVCNQDWSEVMTRLGLEAAGLRTSFHLSLVPVEGTLQVFLDPDGADGNEYGNEDEFEIEEDPTYTSPYAFVYNRVSNSLDFTFDTMPPEAAELRVVYQVAEDA